VKVSTDLRHPLAVTLLANSITLTPGTVTVDVQDGSLLVHALSPKAARGVLGKAMERRILKMVPPTDDPVETGNSR
jgi:multicomponent Na+:H+ antiporter subunit E